MANLKYVDETKEQNSPRNGLVNKNNKTVLGTVLRAAIWAILSNFMIEKNKTVLETLLRTTIRAIRSNYINEKDKAVLGT
jgi:hypothetical protein